MAKKRSVTFTGITSTDLSSRLQTGMAPALQVAIRLNPIWLYKDVYGFIWFVIAL
jgi:hypothetical protein